jgi:hypothetical protein
MYSNSYTMMTNSKTFLLRFLKLHKKFIVKNNNVPPSITGFESTPEDVNKFKKIS